MNNAEKVVLLFQFNSEYYNRNRMEIMVRDATELAKKNVPDAKIDYSRINIYPTQSIINEVINYIDTSSFCVFELSDNNPNVLFELGYAYSKGKGIVLLKNKRSSMSIPSDLSGLFILYYDDPTSLENLTLDLSIYIEDSIKKTIKEKHEYLLRRIWSFGDTDKAIFVSGNINNQYLVLPPDASALLEASLNIRTLYPNVSIDRFYAIDLPQEYENSMNIVSVGGPSSNQVTRRFLDKVNFPWDYIRPAPNEKQILINKISKQKRTRVLDENGYVKRDFGFFMKIPNPSAENKTVFLITAMTTEGVLDCAKKLSYDNDYSKTNSNFLMEFIDDSPYFAAITETIIENGRVVSKPLSHEVYLYDPSKNEWREG